MLPWATDSSFFRQYLQPYSNWVYENQAASILIAIALPLLWVAFRAALQNRRRRRLLEEEELHSATPSRLPQETIDRNRREEARYRKSQQASKSTARRGGSGPRFK
ncbi:MAG: hypothetical protein J0M12_01195 [Deltaproteobacteria bacterium]|nr:hypothetical protein [Deltaproteobacteria bacterium]